MIFLLFRLNQHETILHIQQIEINYLLLIIYHSMQYTIMCIHLTQKTINYRLQNPIAVQDGRSLGIQNGYNTSQ